MTITINNEQYNFEVNGTVGIQFLFNRMTGEDFNPENPDHIIQLYYVILVTSNPDKEVRIDSFIACLTTKLMKEISEYVARRWQELEGEPIKGAKKKKSKA